MSQAITIRARITNTFGFGRKYSRRLAAGEQLTIGAPTPEMLVSIKDQAARGLLDIVVAPTTYDFSASRQTVTNRLDIIIGVDHGSGVSIPNGATLHKIKLGGVAFTLGNGNIDGTNSTTLLSAFLAALAASTSFQATGARVLASSTLAGSALVAAYNTLTSDTTAPADGSTVVVDGKTYTFQTTLTNVDGHVAIGGSAAAALTNLKAAINLSAGAGTTYAAATTAHTTVSATTLTATTLLLVALTAGKVGNALTLSLGGTTHLSITAGTFAGGTEAISLVTIDGAGVTDWAAFQAASALTDASDATISTPDVTLTFFSRVAVDVTGSQIHAMLQRTVTSADVTRGYIELDTGLSDLSTQYAVRITRAGVRILHDGNQSIKSSRVILVQNDGSVDFQAGDIVLAFAAGAD